MVDVQHSPNDTQACLRSSSVPTEAKLKLAIFIRQNKAEVVHCTTGIVHNRQLIVKHVFKGHSDERTRCD